MKSILLAAISLVLCAAANPQPVLTAANSGPRVGDVIGEYHTRFHPVGDGGPAQSWDFSTLTQRKICPGHEPASVVKPGAAAPQRCNVMNGFGDGGQYLSFNSCGVYVLGCRYVTTKKEQTTTFEEDYEDPAMLLRFPLAYGDSFIDSFRVTSRYNNRPSNWVGVDSFWADAWGSITLPGRTLAGVLRVKIIRTARLVRVSSYDSSLDTSYTKLLTYRWYLPGYHTFLLEMEQDMDIPENSCEDCNYGTITVMRTGKDLSVIGNKVPVTLLQNPVHGALQLRTDAGQDIAYRVIDAKGGTVSSGMWHASVAQDLQLSMETRLPGVYSITFTSQDFQPLTQRFVVE
jgi:hypothetical protein